MWKGIKKDFSCYRTDTIPPRDSLSYFCCPSDHNVTAALFCGAGCSFHFYVTLNSSWQLLRIMAAEREMQWVVLNLQGSAHNFNPTLNSAFILPKADFTQISEELVKNGCCEALVSWGFQRNWPVRKNKIVVTLVSSSSLTQTISLHVKTGRTKMNCHKAAICMLGSRTSAAAPTWF